MIHISRLPAWNTENLIALQYPTISDANGQFSMRLAAMFFLSFHFSLYCHLHRLFQKNVLECNDIDKKILSNGRQDLIISISLIANVRLYRT